MHEMAVARGDPQAWITPGSGFRAWADGTSSPQTVVQNPPMDEHPKAAPRLVPRLVFWQRTRRLTLGLLAAWLAVNLLVPWFARDLNALQAWGFPLGYWLAAEGALLIYLLIVVVYAVAMDRLEAQLLQSPPAVDEAGPRTG